MEGFDKLLTRWNEKYYLEPFYILCELIALIVGLILVRKYKVGRVFLFYIAFDFIIIIIDIYLRYFSNHTIVQKNYFLNLSNGIISLVELSTYYYYYSKTIMANRIIKYI